MESFDSSDSPEATPLILGFDVTDSMGFLAEEIATHALNEAIQEILIKKPVTNPQVLCAAFTNPDNPLQVTQFESDIRILEQLMDFKLGGGNALSYDTLLWYFAAKHTQIDCFRKRKKKGILFGISDEACGGYANILTAKQIQSCFGDTVPKDYKFRELKSMAKSQYELIHIVVDTSRQKQRGKSEKILNGWLEALPRRVAYLDEAHIDCLADVIVAILQTLNGDGLELILSGIEDSKKTIIETAIQYFHLDCDPKKELPLLTREGQPMFSRESPEVKYPEDSIREMKNSYSDFDSIWYYNAVLDMPNYDWNYMVETAKYLSELDFPCARLEAWNLGVNQKNILTIDLVDANASGFARLRKQYDVLSIKGRSTILSEQIKIEWYNHSNRICVNSAEYEPPRIRKYIGSVIHRTLETQGEMELETPMAEITGSSHMNSSGSDMPIERSQAEKKRSLQELPLTAGMPIVRQKTSYVRPAAENKRSPQEIHSGYESFPEPDDMSAERHRTRILLRVVVFVALIGLAVFGISSISTGFQYQKAQVLFENGEYREAAALFKKLGNQKYKDSIEKAKQSVSFAQILELKDITVGQTVKFGIREYSPNYGEYTWSVLDIDGDRALLMSQGFVKSMPFHNTNGTVTWEQCTLRRYLNGDWLHDTFSDEQVKRIQFTNVTADQNPGSSTDAGNETQDQVFLFSIDEYLRYFPNAAPDVLPNAGYWIKIDGTKYWVPDYVRTITSERRGTYYGSADNWFWLRTPGDADNKAAVVHWDGLIDYRGCTVDSSGYSIDPLRSGAGVRAVMWITIAP